MATDKTMPPGDPSSMTPSTPPMPSGGPERSGGDVMISLPKASFDMMHQIVMQLASGLDQLAKGINQGAGAAPMGGEMPAEEMGEPAGMGGEPAGGKGSSPEDEEFLRSLMEEGNSKTR